MFFSNPTQQLSLNQKHFAAPTEKQCRMIRLLMEVVTTEDDGTQTMLKLYNLLENYSASATRILHKDKYATERK